jgi:stearoyl-CoA desaturase (Delta-9 desaturase)
MADNCKRPLSKDNTLSNISVPSDLQSAEDVIAANTSLVADDGDHRDPNAKPHVHLKMPWGERWVHFLAVTLPFVGLIAAMVLLWGYHFKTIHLVVLAVGYLLTAIGITVGYHRLFTHKSFETYAPVKFVLAVLGSMAMEGPVLQWVAQHRRHHQHSDDHDDPHSPHTHGNGFKNMLKGIFHAHVGWVMKPDAPGLQRYVADLMQSRMLRWVNSTFFVWAGLGMLIPAVIGGLFGSPTGETWSWMGALIGFLWGGAVRIFLVHHVTWSINSVCHIWGSQDFKSHDESRNNPVFGILALGEGWHNNHHAFPASARHGLKWWQLDISYLIIKGLEAVGLVWKVRTPAVEHMARKRID